MSVCTVCIVITDARLVHTDWARELWDKLFPLRQKREKKKRKNVHAQPENEIADGQEQEKWSIRIILVPHCINQGCTSPPFPLTML